MAIQHTLYISSGRLKKDTALQTSIDDNLIVPYILLAQDMHILPVLGTDLDNDLKTHIQNGTLGDNLNNKTLVEKYIQPCLVQFSFTQLLPFLRLRFVNNAVVIMGSNDQSSPASFDDLRPVMDTATNAAEFYRKRLIDYINDNIANFPKYNTNTGSDLAPTQNNYYSGLNLNNVTPIDNQLAVFLSAANIKTYDC